MGTSSTDYSNNNEGISIKLSEFDGSGYNKFLVATIMAADGNKQSSVNQKIVIAQTQKQDWWGDIFKTTVTILETKYLNNKSSIAILLALEKAELAYDSIQDKTISLGKSTQWNELHEITIKNENKIANKYIISSSIKELMNNNEPGWRSLLQDPTVYNTDPAYYKTKSFCITQ